MSAAALGPLLSRRAFLQASAATAALACLGCTSGGGGEGGGTAGTAPFPFDMWEGLRSAARSSPDHIRAAASRVVETKDPAAIFAFVRDEIALYPAPPGAYDPATAIRWGSDATLRGGAGTLREKADVLCDLYQRAGFKAEVVVGPVPTAVTALKPEAVYIEPARTTDPRLDPDDLARWRDQGDMGPAPTTAKRFDGGGATSAALAGAIAALLPDRAAEPGGAPWPVAIVPMVRVRLDGTDTYALPVAGSELTDHLTSAATEAPPSGPAPTVRVALSMTSTAAPSDVIDLVSHEWPAEEVVGRQVVAQLVPPLGLAERLTLAAGDIHLVVATLSLRRAGDDQATLEKNVVTGQAVTITGQLVEESEAGLRVGGADVAPAPDGAGGAEVAEVSVEVDALDYPSIGLRVSALDAAGKLVPAVPASAFTVTEDGTPVAAFATRNAPPAPRVLLVVDSSLSIDPAFTSVEGRTALASAFAPQLASIVPDAQVQVIGTGSERPDPAGWIPVDVSTLTGALVRAVPVGSAIWTAVAGAEAAQPAVIVLLTDGVIDETDAAQLPALRAATARGAPVVVVGIGDVDEATLDAIAALSRGTRVAVTGPADVDPIVAAVEAHLTAATLDPYRLTYDAPGEGTAPRTVVVAVGGVTAEATYTPPTPAERTTPPGLRGLYLTVAVGSETPVTRVLAGLAAVPVGATGPLVTPATIEAVRRALFDTVVVSVEGAAPSLMTWLDDDLTGRLSGRALWEAAEDGDGEAMLAALTAGVSVVPWQLAGLHAPLLHQHDGPLTYERLLRVAVLVDRAGSRRGDILPLTRFDTLDADRTAAFAQTLRQSARLAVGEGTVFEESAMSLLDGADLTLLADGRFSADALSALPESTRDTWPRLVDQYPLADKVIPAGGDPVAFWAVDQQTGTVLGVLDDGSGGGRSARHAAPCDDQLSDQAFNALGALGGGPYAAVGKACARIYARAGRTLQAGPVPDKGDPNDIMRDLACDLAKDAAFGGMGGFGEVAGPVDDMADMFGQDLPCPGGPSGGGPKLEC